LAVSGIRIGIGYDVHRVAPRRRLVLAGVEIPGPVGLAGHSDADVITHSLCDALLGALNLGDLGTHFPDTEVTYRDANSLDLLSRVVEMVRARGWEVVNADCVLVSQGPKIQPYAQEMRLRLAERLGVSPEQVSVKATTNEGIGFVGRGEGMAAYAVALLQSNQRG